MRGFVPEWFKEKIKLVSRFVAYLRTTVSRYERGLLQNEVIYQPQLESPNRTLVQFQRLAISLAIVLDKKEIDEEIFRLILKVALSSLNEFTIRIVAALSKSGGYISLTNISLKTNIATSALITYLKDLVVLGLVINKDSNYILREDLKNIWLTIFQ